jgi:hypothetical protein
MLRKRFFGAAWVGIVLLAQPVWSQNNTQIELPEADSIELRVIPQSLASSYQPSEPPGLLAFSPDNNALAYSSSKNTKRQSPFGDIWASQLHLLSLNPFGVTETLVDAKTTEKFAFYGAPAMRLAWQDDKILFVISNGDDEATQLTYLTQKQRLENPNIGEHTIDEAPSLSALEQLIQQCFADWPADVVEHSNAIWLQEGQSALYQARYAGMSDDIWWLDVANCQRQHVPVPTEKSGQRLRHSLVGGVINHSQLVLVLESYQGKSKQSHTLLLQTTLDSLDTDDAIDTGSSIDHRDIRNSHSALHAGGIPDRNWNNWSYGLGSHNQLTMLGSTKEQTLFVLSNSQKPCSVRLYSLSQRQLHSFMVDGHHMCNAAVSNDGHLALSLYAYPNLKQMNKAKVANRIWVVNPGFLAGLAD